MAYVVEEGFLGVFPELLVEGLLEDAHPGRHEESEGQRSETCERNGGMRGLCSQPLVFWDEPSKDWQRQESTSPVASKNKHWPPSWWRPLR